MNDPIETNANPFPLHKLEPLFNDLQLPTEPFDPQGTWKHTYQCYTIAKNMMHNGTLAIYRSPSNNGRILLQIEFQKKLLQGDLQVLRAKMVCRCDDLTTPMHWSFDVKTLGQSDDRCEPFDISKTAVLKEGHIEIAYQGNKRHLNLPKSYSSEWSLFDAVQRLKADRNVVLQFNLLEDFDRFKPEQELSFIESQQISLGQTTAQEPNRPRRRQPVHSGNATIEVEMFRQLGRGISPTFYWRDSFGRLLFVVAGIEAYVLSTHALGIPERKTRRNEQI
ncbi:MAG TPA: hypothetical protein PKH07_18225 [bacterium]|nr:hypothetical protein [bacterium]